MILIAEDNPGKQSWMGNALTSECEVAVCWAEYCELRDRLLAEGRLTAVCLDVGDFNGRGPDQMRDEAFSLRKRGVRVVMWSQAASQSNTPKDVLCARSEVAGVVTAVAHYLETGKLPSGLSPDVAKHISEGTWIPAPALADLVAFDLLCQGYLAIAGSNPKSGLHNEVVDTLRAAGSLGEERLAEATRPEHQHAIADPRVWFTPARQAVERDGRNASELWGVLSNDLDAVTPIRRLYEALTDRDVRPAGEWHQLVAGAVAGFRRIADRREL